MNFGEEYMNEKDPSILHFLLASGDDVLSFSIFFRAYFPLINSNSFSSYGLYIYFRLLVNNFVMI